MAHPHHHGHDHDHAITRNERLLARAFLLIGGFMFVEVIGGLLANSLTLLADAGHMFLDASALAFSWYAVRLSRRLTDERLSYGYHRWEVLAAFVNGLTLMALVVWILVEAWERLQSPQAMLPLPALAVAFAGFIVNVIAYRWLHGSDDSAAVESAALHVLGDLLGSVAAMTAAIVYWLSGWPYADPLLAVVIAAILGRGAWRVLSDATHILLEGVPDGINLESIAETITARVPGVTGVHHLHAWALTAQRPLLTLHASVDEPADLSLVMQRIKAVLSEDFGIEHSTVQVDHGQCPDHK
ncbi:MAG: cation diffusion facilitator family transporter [Pseudomonadales bacterium]